MENEIKQYLFLGGIPLTDWIQAIAALVAIIAAIVGFRKLYLDIKENESQINHLSKIAEQSVFQTEHLSNQVEKMSESNALMADYLQLFQQFVENNKIEGELAQKRAALDERKRKMAIKPIFERNDGYNSHYNMVLTLKNAGGDATILEIIENQENSVRHNLNGFKGQTIRNGNTIGIALTPRPLGLRIEQCFVSLEVIISDIEGNHYQMNLNGVANVALVKIVMVEA